MKNALYGFAFGVLLCVVAGVFWWISAGSKLEDRYLEDLRRTRIELADAERSLEAVSGDLREAEDRLGDAIADLGRSQGEVAKLRSILGSGQGAVDSGLVGVERIRKIIQRLPLLE